MMCSLCCCADDENQEPKISPVDVKSGDGVSLNKVQVF